MTALVFAATGAQPSSASDNLPAPYFDTYEQSVTITFRDRQSAQAASIKVLPLYNGYEWAVSTRWDDNNPEDVKMRDVLAQHGYRATFYLNSPEQIPVPNWNDWEQSLFEGGNTLGGHSWSHPFLTYCSRNTMFDQIARIRVEREASSDRAINSYAFSFCDFMNPVEGDIVREDIAELLFRAGYYHAANALFTKDLESRMLVSHLLPPDGMAPIDDEFARILADPEIKKNNPNITFNMHVWYKTPEAWANFEAELERYGHNPAWWYCNQSEYAAYRLQYLYTRVAPHAKREALELTLTRPVVPDLNDAIPLTLEIAGVAAEAVASISFAGGPIERRDENGSVRFELPHDPDQRLPERIGWIKNDENYSMLNTEMACDAFDGLLGNLHLDGDTVRLVLDNRGGALPLRALTIRYRLPLQHQMPAIRHFPSPLEAGGYLRDAIALTTANDAAQRSTAKYAAGSAFYVAQLDFRYGEKPARLYLTCNGAITRADAAFPAEGFVRLGPIPHNLFTLDWAEAAIAKPFVVPTLEGLGPLAWEPAAAAIPGRFDPEVVHTTGRWLLQEADPKGYYLLRSTVGASHRHAVSWRYTPDCVEAIYINGHKLEGDTATLERGPNDLVIVYATVRADFDPNNFETVFQTLRPSNAGFFLRAAAADTGTRLDSLRYRRPLDPLKTPVPGLGL